MHNTLHYKLLAAAGAAGAAGAAAGAGAAAALSPTRSLFYQRARHFFLNQLALQLKFKVIQRSCRTQLKGVLSLGSDAFKKFSIDGELTNPHSIMIAKVRGL